MNVIISFFFYCRKSLIEKRAFDKIEQSDFGLLRKRFELFYPFRQGKNMEEMNNSGKYHHLDEHYHTIKKRGFDRIDDADFGLFKKRAFDRIDEGFGLMKKRAFDRLDTSEFGLRKRGFLPYYLEQYEISSPFRNHLFDFLGKKGILLLIEPNYNENVEQRYKRAFDRIESSDFGFHKRSIADKMNDNSSFLEIITLFFKNKCLEITRISLSAGFLKEYILPYITAIDVNLSYV